MQAARPSRARILGDQLVDHLVNVHAEEARRVRGVDGGERRRSGARRAGHAVGVRAVLRVVLMTADPDRLAFERLCGSEPVLIDIRPAGEVVPGMTPDRSSPRARRCPGSVRRRPAPGDPRRGAVRGPRRATARRPTRSWPRARSASRLPRPRLRRLGRRHLHGVDAGVRGREPAVRQPRVLQLLRGRVARAGSTTASTTTTSRPAGLRCTSSVAPMLGRRRPARRRDPAEADHPPRAPHGRRAAQPQHGRHAAVRAGAAAARCSSSPPRTVDACARRARVPARERLLLPAAVDGRGEGDRRRRARRRGLAAW